LRRSPIGHSSQKTVQTVQLFKPLKPHERVIPLTRFSHHLHPHPRNHPRIVESAVHPNFFNLLPEQMPAHRFKFVVREPGKPFSAHFQRTEISIAQSESLTGEFVSQEPDIELCVMGYQNTVSNEVPKLREHFFRLGLPYQHIIRDAMYSSDRAGDLHPGIDQCMKFSDDIFALNGNSADLDDSVAARGGETGRFNVEDHMLLLCQRKRLIYKPFITRLSVVIVALLLNERVMRNVG
jgi:hypothetical protein